MMCYIRRMGEALRNHQRAGGIIKDLLHAILILVVIYSLHRSNQIGDRSAAALEESNRLHSEASEIMLQMIEAQIQEISDGSGAGP